MKKVFTMINKMNSLVIMGLLCSLAPMVVAEVRDVVLSADKASRLVSALSRVTRAVRPDAPVLGDRDYPVVSDSIAEDLAAIREILCIISEQLGDCDVCSLLEQIQEDLEDIKDTLGDCNVCSTLSVIDNNIGDPCGSNGEGIDLCDCTDTATVQDLNSSVISLLKTILLELRGLVGQADYCVACPSVSDLPDWTSCSFAESLADVLA